MTKELFGDFWWWWYGSGWQRARQIIAARVHQVLDFFSIRTLILTLFAPWKRDVLSTRNLSLSDQIQVLIANILSRLIGAVVRVGVITIGIVVVGLLLVGGGLYLLGWLLLPVIPLVLLIVGASVL